MCVRARGWGGGDWLAGGGAEQAFLFCKEVSAAGPVECNPGRRGQCYCWRGREVGGSKVYRVRERAAASGAGAGWERGGGEKREPVWDARGKADWGGGVAVGGSKRAGEQNDGASEAPRKKNLGKEKLREGGKKSFLGKQSKQNNKYTNKK